MGVSRAAGVSRASFAAIALMTSLSAAAEESPDLGRYDCTRLDDGESARGDDLAREGFQIASVGRFGQPNVMLVEPRSKARANCIARRESN